MSNWAGMVQNNAEYCLLLEKILGKTLPSWVLWNPLKLQWRVDLRLKQGLFFILPPENLFCRNCRESVKTPEPL